MSSPVRPESVPGFVPGDRGLSVLWQQYMETPYVQDTLAMLVGNEPVQVSSLPRPRNIPEGVLAGTTNLGNMFMFTEPTQKSDTVFTHEVGHVIDHRQLAPEVADSVRRIFAKKHPAAFVQQFQSDVGGEEGLPTEYVAETFRAAMMTLRGQEDSTRNERQLPGTSIWMRWIRAHMSGSPVVLDPDQKE